MVESHVIDGGLVDNDGKWRNLSEFHPELSEMALSQFYPTAELGNDKTSKWAPNLTALCGWVNAAGFEITNKWSVAFRGGVSASKRHLPEHSARRIDAAREWDLVEGLVIKDGDPIS